MNVMQDAMLAAICSTDVISRWLLLPPRYLDPKVLLLFVELMICTASGDPGGDK
jgi:hypothetical protein